MAGMLRFIFSTVFVAVVAGFVVGLPGLSRPFRLSETEEAAADSGFSSTQRQKEA